MKFKIVALLLVPLLICVGCAKKTSTTTPAPPPAGSLNTFDATTNETLQSIHAFVASMVAQNNAGTVTLTPTQKQLLNQLVTDVNNADVIYQAWHAAGGTGATTTVQAALTKAQTDQTSLNSAISGGQ